MCGTSAAMKFKTATACVVAKATSPETRVTSAKATSATPRMQTTAAAGMAARLAIGATGLKRWKCHAAIGTTPSCAAIEIASGSASLPANASLE